MYEATPPYVMTCFLGVCQSVSLTSRRKPSPPATLVNQLTPRCYLLLINVLLAHERLAGGHSTGSCATGLPMPPIVTTLIPK